MRTGTPRSRFTRTRARPSAAGPKASTPDGRIEPLERRVLLATFVVSTADESGPGSIREALAMAEANSGPDTIAFDESLAAPGTKITVSSPLVLNGPVTVLGPERAKLTLEGNNATRVLDVASDAVVALSGLRISGGSADGGGGIRNQGTLTLDHVLVSGNSATGFGGGISNLFGTLTLHNSSVSRNSAQYGAGLSNDFGDVTLLDSDISNNTASNGGGGVINQATLTLTRSTVSGNSALNGIGGGINNGGTLNINHATIANNSASFSGGIDNSFSGTATIVYGNVSGNSARTGGGIGNSGKLTLANSSVSGNTAVSRGGGISQSGGTATLINVTVSGNSVTASSGSGGGIDSTAALEIYSTTVADNRAARGGGIRVIGDTKLYNSIIANNYTAAASVAGRVGISADTPSDAAGSLEALKVLYVFFGMGGTAGVPAGQNGVQTGDPMIEPMPTADGITYCPRFGSPVIDAGDMSLLPPNSLNLDGSGDTAKPIPEDQTAAKRVVGEQVDIGSYEFREAPQVVSVSPKSSTWTEEFDRQWRKRYEFLLAAKKALGLPGGFSWADFDFVSCRFDRSVSVKQDDIRITGVNVANYIPIGFQYDPATFTATWILRSINLPDNIVIKVSSGAGGVVDATTGKPLDGDGDGNPGGDAVVGVHIVVGEITGDDKVGGLDALKVRQHSGTSIDEPRVIPEYDLVPDINGDGRINQQDQLIVRRNWGRHLPAGEPVATAATPVAALTPARRMAPALQAALAARSARLPTSRATEDFFNSTEVLA